MIERILPAEVSSVDTVDDHELDLFPEEEAAIAKAVDKRRREFTSARYCARRALAAIGVAAVPLVPGERGAPSWPDGVVGSMTHCAGYRAAVVARRTDVVSVGIDAEPHAPLPDGVLRMVGLPAERTMLAELGTELPDLHADRLLFCAKESVYKTWFPLTGKWLGFEEARIAIDPDGTFTARLLVTGPMVDGREVTTFHGRWLVADGIAVTAITLLP